VNERFNVRVEQIDTSRHAEYEACRSLWLAVLTQAVKEAQLGRGQAVLWLANDPEGDFTAVCEMADMDPDVVREGLVAWAGEQ
jgi:hypothetical protein